MTDPVASSLITTFPVVLTIIVTAWLQRRAAADERAKADAKLDTIVQHVNGGLSAVKEVADKFAAEVIRLQTPGATTPYGEPSAAHPVTLSAGIPTVLKPERTPAPPTTLAPPEEPR